MPWSTPARTKPAIVQTLESLGVGASFEFVKVKRRGIGATKFRVTVAETKRYRHLPAIVKIIEASGAPQRAKTRAIAAFEHSGRAETAVHQVPIEKVHFHEVRAADSIADMQGKSDQWQLHSYPVGAPSAQHAGFDPSLGSYSDLSARLTLDP